MARWIFRQVKASMTQGRPAKWIWELQQSYGEIIKRSENTYADLMICMDDAARHGYDGAHYAVYVHNSKRPIIRAS